MNSPDRSGTLIPWRLKQALQPAAFSAGLLAVRRGFRNASVFRWLNMGWGNEGWSADTFYLEAVCDWARRVRGPILECGSGLTTLLLGMNAGDRVTTLEHLPEWGERVQTVAAKYSIPANVITAPLADYGEFHWYALPDAPRNCFELVVCDGPPSKVLGGRYGLLPAAGSLLSRSAVILMDDVERPDEQAILQRWKREFGIGWQEHQTSEGTYAEVWIGNRP